MNKPHCYCPEPGYCRARAEWGDEACHACSQYVDAETVQPDKTRILVNALTLLLEATNRPDCHAFNAYARQVAREALEYS